MFNPFYFAQVFLLLQSIQGHTAGQALEHYVRTGDPSWCDERLGRYEERVAFCQGLCAARQRQMRSIIFWLNTGHLGADRAKDYLQQLDSIGKTAQRRVATYLAEMARREGFRLCRRAVWLYRSLFFLEASWESIPGR